VKSEGDTIELIDLTLDDEILESIYTNVSEDEHQVHPISLPSVEIAEIMETNLIEPSVYYNGMLDSNAEFYSPFELDFLEAISDKDIQTLLSMFET
jgi:hypothetical protein